MALIVEVMLSRLIDVSSSVSNINRANPNPNDFNTDNDCLQQPLIKSLSSTNVPLLPDVGLNNITPVLSRPTISSDICRFVTITASELSNLYSNEIKIMHKEELVVTFE